MTGPPGSPDGDSTERKSPQRGAFRGKGGLGRGLGALIPGAVVPPTSGEARRAASSTGRPVTSDATAPLAAEADAAIASRAVEEEAARSGPTTVDIDLIAPNPRQPRTSIAPGLLESLADSIRQHGLLQPLVVSRVRSGHGVSYQLIAGERRWHASRAAGLKRVPVVIREVTPQQQLELALVENIQRADLNPLEEASAFQRLASEFGLTQEALAQRVGRSRVAVANTLRLLGLSDEIKASLAAGEITEGHARALLGLADPGTRRQLWQQVQERSLSVRETEMLVRTLRDAPPDGGDGAATAPRPARRRDDPDVAALAERLQSTLGTAVRINLGRRGGKIVINFYSDEELNALADRLLAGSDDFLR